METTPNAILGDAEQDPSKLPDEDDAEDSKESFAIHFNELMNDFGSRCENLKIEYALAIVINPITGQPQIFCRGEESYIQAKLARVLLYNLRARVLEDLSI